MTEIQNLLKTLSHEKAIKIISGNHQLTGEDLSYQIEKRTDEFKKLHFPKSARICFSFRRNLNAMIDFLALQNCGWITFVLNPAFQSDKLIRIIHTIQPHGLFIDPTMRQLLQKRLCEHQQLNFSCFSLSHLDVVQFHQAPAILDKNESMASVAILTSGSTGEPKAILHSSNAIFKNAALHARSMGISPEDQVAMILPCHYSYGLVANLLGTLVSGATLVLYEGPNLPSPEWFSQFKISVLNTTPTRLLDLSLHPLSGLRVLSCGGDQTPLRLAKEFLNSYPNVNFYATYGLTEAGPRVATLHVDHDEISKNRGFPLGQFLPGIHAQLSVSDRLGPEDQGELLLETPTAMLGYFNDPIQTSHAFCKQTQYLMTGDVIKRNHQGEMFFASRKKRIISRGGEKIYPSEIEFYLLQVPGITQAWVQARADDRLGEVPEAYLVSRLEIKEREVVQFLKRHLPTTQIPVAFFFFEKLPEFIHKK